MLLSIQQKFILESLKKLGYAKCGQLLILTREKFRRPDLEITQARMDAMLRQLRGGMGDFRLGGGLVSLSAVTPDPLRLEAVDVMLELTGGRPLDFNARLKPPLLLQFTWGPDEASARPFSVALLAKSEEQQAERLSSYRRARVIWLSDTNTMPEGLSLPPKHFFAARMPDGTHRFYGSNGP